ncbi:MAG TPA: hypothetical protein VD794_07730 [Flavisolibacter sp.]|nr:hypothetical protein [Flavisolibacter sp.]
MQSVNINLGKPNVGWLPIDILASDFKLSFEASDLGLNVLDQLADMVIGLDNNRAAECYFYLEPGAYVLKTKPSSDIVDLQIEFTEDFDMKDDQVFEPVFHAEVNASEFRKSLINTLQVFLNIDYPESDWPSPEKSTILKQLVNS